MNDPREAESAGAQNDPDSQREGTMVPNTLDNVVPDIPDVPDNDELLPDRLPSSHQTKDAAKSKISKDTSKEDYGKRTLGATAEGHAEYETAFDLTGHGSFNRLVLITCCLIYVYASLEMMAITYILIPAECDLKLTLANKSLISSSTFIGNCLSALLWGLLSDMYGRRITMLIAMVISIVSSIASSFSISFAMMFVLRFITGIAVSGPSSIVLVYLGEMEVGKFKDRSLALCIMSGQMSFIILPVLAWIIIPKSWTFEMGLIVRPWRVFMWLWAFVGVIGVALLCSLPESPRWILATQGVAPTVPILAKIFSRNQNRPASDFPTHSVQNFHTLHNVQGHWMSMMNDLKQLLRPPMWRCLWVCSFGVAVVFFLERGFYIWVPEFMNEALKHAKKSWNICTIIHYYTSQPDVGGDQDEDCSVVAVSEGFYPVAMVMEMLLLVPFLIVFCIIRKYLRVKMYAVIMYICAAGQILSLIPQAFVSVIFITVGMSCGACFCLLQIMAFDAFPTNLRGMSVSTLFMAGKLGAFVGTSIVGIMRGVGCFITIILMASLTAGSSKVLLRFWPRPLAQVRNQMEARDFIY